MTTFALLLTSAGFASQGPGSALQFARAVLQLGHSIDHIFLYQDAVLLASNQIDLPADEPDISAELAEFCQRQQIPLLFCVTAAEKRGLMSETVPARNGYIGAGLAEFALRQSNVDKLVQF
ncbi:MAG: sulfurtransferase complex subunit TusD [Gammaproteobacteria bacterium]|nr:sulfurtransferase complex subunit TusD [Gammaproteobacteria bacterium]MBU1554021.1 sulfurtransferase complex subunit TusD [Gammaproteobacteria bacterium]MBU2069257.1 sulfurtransferase complex subunit TusD [Gammaproteobacteria bacterium]MBU2182154.1 sulfurtransferase complex subunit TusD [Gammaproteobacteria bacterium]MBU2206181.1 sulfurtransferase complex subunit TusD [Gammaproteobacteria bacterium]